MVVRVQVAWVTTCAVGSGVGTLGTLHVHGTRAFAYTRHASRTAVLIYRRAPPPPGHQLQSTVPKSLLPRVGARRAR